MSVVGVVVEYNPLHNGHAHHLTQAKAITGAQQVVAVLSGPFLQRGEPALVSKFARTEMALAAGCDLVLELPVAYAPQPAEWFAYGAVSLLHATGVVDSLCFGSESGALTALKPLAQALAHETTEFQLQLSLKLGEGLSYPTAYSAAAAATINQFMDAESITALLAAPNNTLGLHYLLALERLRSPIEAFSIPRIHAGYHDIEPSHARIASATAIRRMLLSEGIQAAAPYLPPATIHILEREFAAGRGPITWDSLFPSLLHKLFTSSQEELRHMHEVSEGLEHRLRRSLFKLEHYTLEALLTELKTKRYTRTKLQRMLTHILLNHDQASMAPDQLRQGPAYLRVLGFSTEGQKLLKRMKSTASLPIVTRASSMEHPQLELDLRASLVYGQAYQAAVRHEVYRDYLAPPIRI